MQVDLGILFSSLPVPQTPYAVILSIYTQPNAQQVQELWVKDARVRSAGLICLTIEDLIAANSSYTTRYTIQRNDGGLPRSERPGEWWLMSAEESAEMFADGHVDDLAEFEMQEGGDQVFWDK